MEDHGLIAALDDARITAISQRDHRADAFEKLCRSYFPSCQIQFIINPYSNDHEMVNNLDSDITVSENETMRRMWLDCQQQDMNILYLHAKGITSYIRFLQSGDTERFRMYHAWRQYLNWGVIENWRICMGALHDYDMAGVNFYQLPLPHFSGAFWWATSAHIRRLPDPRNRSWWHQLRKNASDPWMRTAPDRYRDEQWPTHLNGSKIFSLNPLSESHNPAWRYLTRNVYAVNDRN